MSNHYTDIFPGIRRFGKEDFLLTSESRRDKEKRWGGVAQSVEQRTENPRVPSSILGPATNDFK
jgi:hypothetical protein